MPSVIESPGVDLALPFLNNSYIAKPCGSAQALTMPGCLFLQIAAGAGQRAAGTDRADETVDLAAGLLPDLRAGRIRNAPWHCRGCSTGRRTARRSARSCEAGRPAAVRHADSCWDWRRAAPAPRSVRRRTAAACPSFPGSGFPGSGSASGSRGRWRPPPARCRYCRRSTSTTSPPGLRSPRFSASRIIHLPARSLTDWPGFMNSALPRMVQPVSSDACFSLMRGVLPIASMTSLLKVMFLKLPVCLPNRWATLKDRRRAYKPAMKQGCQPDLRKHHLTHVDISRQESSLAVGEVIFPEPPEAIVES